MSAFAGRAGTNQLGNVRLLPALCSRWLTTRRMGENAPHLPFAIPVRAGSVGWRPDIRRSNAEREVAPIPDLPAVAPRSGEVRPIADIPTGSAAPKPLKSACSRYGAKFVIIEEPNCDVVLDIRGCSRNDVPTRSDAQPAVMPIRDRIPCPFTTVLR
jgi:hypothetical protein